MSRLMSLLLAMALTSACATMKSGTPAAANSAVEALQASDFDRAYAEAMATIEKYPGNSRARAVAGLTLFKKTMHQFFFDAMSIAMAAFRGGVNHRYMRWTLEQTEAGLATVDEHLGVAAADPDFYLNQCLACWQNDWNHDGEIDWRDETIFQVELDTDGNSIPEDDPRRKPTFRFDVGDIHWARAMVAFQRTALNILLAYKWSELSDVVRQMRGGDTDDIRITIRMNDVKVIHRARDILLAGLEHADAARIAYLAETDDEREWVPNPAQKNHPMPLPVDQALYDTWAGVLADVGKLIRGETGISVEEVAQLGDHQWQDPPQGYVNVGMLLEQPGDFVLDLGHMDAFEDDHTRANVERILTDIFGEKYVPQMAGTELIARMTRMKNEIKRGEESLERKLRYLLWLN
jgi:hypothetical protein